jgi:hypothetical protein
VPREFSRARVIGGNSEGQGSSRCGAPRTGLCARVNANLSFARTPQGKPFGAKSHHGKRGSRAVGKVVVVVQLLHAYDRCSRHV